MIIFTIIVIVVIFLTLVGLYNSLVTEQNEVTNAQGAIDAMLKKRFDLLPNLVATVKQYAQHESDTFTKVTGLRSQSFDQLSEQEKRNFDADFTKAQQKLYLVAENYPQLKASGNFMHLQHTLNEIEEQLSASRRAFNAAVTKYNNSIQTFPGNIMAKKFHFTAKEVYVIEEQEAQLHDVHDLFKRQ